MWGFDFDHLNFLATDYALTRSSIQCVEVWVWEKSRRNISTVEESGRRLPWPMTEFNLQKIEKGMVSRPIVLCSPGC